MFALNFFLKEQANIPIPCGLAGTYMILGRLYRTVTIHLPNDRITVKRPSTVQLIIRASISKLRWTALSHCAALPGQKGLSTLELESGNDVCGKLESRCSRSNVRDPEPAHINNRHAVLRLAHSRLLPILLTYVPFPCGTHTALMSSTCF